MVGLNKYQDKERRKQRRSFKKTYDKYKYKRGKRIGEEDFRGTIEEGFGEVE